MLGEARSQRQATHGETRCRQVDKDLSLDVFAQRKARRPLALVDVARAQAHAEVGDGTKVGIAATDVKVARNDDRVAIAEQRNQSARIACRLERRLVRRRVLRHRNRGASCDAIAACLGTRAKHLVCFCVDCLSVPIHTHTDTQKMMKSLYRDYIRWARLFPCEKFRERLYFNIREAFEAEVYVVSCVACSLFAKRHAY